MKKILAMLTSISSCSRKLSSMLCIVFVLAVVLGTISVAYAENDSVQGSGAAPSILFNIGATSGPNGEGATGYTDFTVPTGFSTGSVQHLCVSGEAAVVTGYVLDGLFAGRGFVYFVQDRSATGQADLIQLQIVDYIPSSCPTFEMTAPQAVTSGDIIVVDAAVPPPPPPAVTFDSLSALAVQYVLASGAPGCEGISNALASQLTSAKKAAERGNGQAMQGALGAFIATVSNLDRFLTQEQINELINMAGSL